MLIPVGANAQEIQQMKMFRFQFSTEFAQRLASNPGLFVDGKPRLQPQALVQYALEAAEAFVSDQLGEQKQGGLVS